MLLLQDLLKHTPEQHPDHASIAMAFQQMQETAVRINETKRAAELAQAVVNLCRFRHSLITVRVLLDVFANKESVERE